MNINEIESLLLQEMEDVKGGLTSGICRCTSGAAQKPESKCICESAANQELKDNKDKDDDDKDDTCVCESGAGQ